MPAVIPIIYAASAAGTYYAARSQANGQRDSTRAMIDAEQQRMHAEEQARQEALADARQREETSRVEGEESADQDYGRYYRRAVGARDLAHAFGFDIPETPPTRRVLGNGLYSSTGGDPAQWGQGGTPSAAPPTTTPTATASAPSTSTDPVAAIRDYQRTHAPTDGLDPLLKTLQAQGVDAKPYLYGDTPSKNEITLNGQKYKVLGAENSGTPFWYTGGDDSGGSRRSSRDKTLASLFTTPDPTFSAVDPLTAPQFAPVFGNRRRPMTVGAF